MSCQQVSTPPGFARRLVSQSGLVHTKAEMLTSDNRRLERAEMLNFGHVAYLRGAISRP